MISTTCPHFTAPDQCRLIAELAGVPSIVGLTQQACDHCTRGAARPRCPESEVVVSLAIYQHRTSNQERAAEIRRTHGHLLRKINPTTPPTADNGRLALILSGSGPGSQLWRLLTRLGVKHKHNCTCEMYALQMNAWGSDSCRKKRAEIVEHMRQNASRYGWGEIAGAAARAVISGLVFRLSPVDPYGSLLDEAIRLAELERAA